MSKPLVEPISKASPLNWLKNLFISDSMRDYISAEELIQIKREKHTAELAAQRELLDTSENTELLATGSKDNSAPTHNPAKPSEDKWLAFSFKELLKAAYLKTYEFDGYDVTTNKYVTTKGDTYNYADRAFNRLLHTVGFIGFPNRPDNRETSKFTAKLAGEEEEKQYADAFNFPKLSPSQFGFNFIGGLHRGTAKKFMKLIQIPLAPVKVVIFLIKIATFPLKLALNIVKFPTELLATLIADVTAQQIGYQVKRIGEINESQAKGNALEKYGRFGLIFLLGILHYSFRTVSIVTRLIFSPEKSARIAWKTGRSIDIEGRPFVTSFLSIVVGSIGVAISIGLTIALWSILIPLIVGAAMTFAPAVVTPVVTWFLQLPLVGTSIGMLNGALATVSSVIGAAFTPYITAITGLAVGLQIPAEAVALGATLAVIVAPTASFLSFVADRFSNYWARAGKYGPYSYFFPPKGYMPLKIVSPKDDQGPGAGPTQSPRPGQQQQSGVPLHTVGSSSPKTGSTSTPGTHTPPKSNRDHDEHVVGDDRDVEDFSKTLDADELNALANDLQKDDLTPRSQARALAAQQSSDLQAAGGADAIATTAGELPTQRPVKPTRVGGTAHPAAPTFDATTSPHEVAKKM